MKILGAPSPIKPLRVIETHAADADSEDSLELKINNTCKFALAINYSAPPLWLMFKFVLRPAAYLQK